MRLLPREQDRLLLFLAAELARRRRARGLALNQSEAVALISDEVCEAARDGRGYAEAEAVGYRALGPGDVADGVAALVRRIEVEALFADGSRLLVLHDPITATGPPAEAEAELDWLGQDHAMTVVNEGEVPVGVTSHFHFFEVNRALRFERAAAWGMRLAIAPGEKVFFDPGIPRKVFLVPFGGARVIRGHAGLADGPLDADGALEAALALARERGYRGA
jgi:urease subunit gamma/beta